MTQPSEELLNFQSPLTIKRFLENNPISKDEAHLIFSDVKRLLWLWDNYDKLATAEEQNSDIGFSKSTNILEKMWQCFILSTRDYETFCTNYLSSYHHHPRLTPVFDANVVLLGKEEAEEIYLTEMLEIVLGNLGEDVTIRWFDTYLKYADKAYENKILNMRNKKRLDYKSVSDVPRFTKEGFTIKDVPSELFAAITNFNEKSKDAEEDEYEEGSKLETIISSKKHRIATSLRQIDSDLRTKIINYIQPELETWTGIDLFPTYVYGIRTYRRGAELKMHKDTLQTNIISVIINVDQKVDEPWALQIKDHEGELSEVLLKPGEMCLYESATLEHGRVKPFNGDYFSNVFASFIPLN